MNSQSKVVLAALITVLVLGGGSRTVFAVEQLSDSVLQQIQALEDEKSSRTEAQNKLDSQFIYALNEKKSGLALSSAPQLKADVQILGNNEVLVDITATVSDDLVGQIKVLGGLVLGRYDQFDSIRALMPLDGLESLASRSD